MDKFGLNYIVKITPFGKEAIIVQPPFTIDIDITRNTLTSANICKLRIHNLSRFNRTDINKNQGDYSQLMSLELQAGYGNRLATIFSGDVTQAFSMREKVDNVTQIECYDGGYAYQNGVVNQSFKEGTSLREVYTYLASNLPYIKIGAIGDYQGVLKRGIVLSGNTTQILAELTGGGFFIDNGIANILQNNEVISLDQDPIYIGPDSGLLGTPILEQYVVRFDMVFEPTLNIGYVAKIDSVTGINFNGNYKIIGVKHRGTISSAVASSIVTTGEFFYDQRLKGAS